MPEAERILRVPPPPAAPPLRAAELGHSKLLNALEAILEPVVTVLSLWALVWYFEGEVSSAWLIASVVAFALAFPGRQQLRLTPEQVFVGTVLTWSWTAGLMLVMAFATGHITDFSRMVVLNWLWFAPAAQLVVHWGLRRAAQEIGRAHV